jgi:hypothetical protein
MSGMSAFSGIKLEVEFERDEALPPSLSLSFNQINYVYLLDCWLPLFPVLSNRDEHWEFDLPHPKKCRNFSDKNKSHQINLSFPPFSLTGTDSC